MPQEVISHRFKLMSTLTSRSLMIDTNQMKKGHTETLLCAFCNCCTILKRYIGLHIEVVQIIQVTWLLGQVRDSVQYSSIFTFERGLPAQVALICSPLSGPCIHLIVEAQQVSNIKNAESLLYGLTSLHSPLLSSLKSLSVRFLSVASQETRITISTEDPHLV